MTVSSEQGRWENIGKILSILWFISLFTLLPQALKLIWPSFINLAQLLQQKYGGSTVFWIYGISANLANIAVIVGYNLVMWKVYVMKNPFLEQFRVSPKTPWPWEQDIQAWMKMLRKTVLVVIFNSVILSGVLSFGQILLHDLRYTYTMEDWPSIFQIVSQFIVFLTYMEIVSYWAHENLHHPSLYFLHKRHHQYNTSISLTATYANPIEYIFSNILSVAICIPLLSLITKVHVVTIIPWLVFRLIETAQVHSGYNFPWGVTTFLPFKNKSEFHDFHHSHNSGNYGSMFTFMDNLMKTDQAFKEFKGRKEKK